MAAYENVVLIKMRGGNILYFGLLMDALLLYDEGSVLVKIVKH